MSSIHEKNGGRKSRDTAPLISAITPCLSRRGNSRCIGICLVFVPYEYVYKSQTYTVSSASTMPSLVFMRRCRLFSGKCSPGGRERRYPLRKMKFFLIHYMHTTEKTDGYKCWHWSIFRYFSSCANRVLNAAHRFCLAFFLSNWKDFLQTWLEVYFVKQIFPRI